MKPLIFRRSISTLTGSRNEVSCDFFNHWTMPVENTEAKSKGVIRILRLSQKADKLIRKRLERKGDVSRLVNQAVLSTNLNEIPVTPRDNTPGSGRDNFYSTSVVFDPSAYEKATKAASNKKVSATVLIDTAIINFYSKPKSSNSRQSASNQRIKPKRRSN